MIQISLNFIADKEEKWVNVGEFFVNESGQLNLKFCEGMEETLWEGMFIGHFRVQKLSRSKRS